MFTDDEEPKHLAIDKSDIIFARDAYKRNMAKSQVTFDIDNVMAIFTNLSVINAVIGISIVSNPIRNLKESVHLAHQGAPLHHIPHFHLDHFGHDSKFDLYVMLPALYDKKRKRERGNLHNHVSKEIRVEFMNTCFLPAIEEVIDNNDDQSWDLRYDMSKIKSTAAARESNMYHKKSSEFHQEISKNLDLKYIDLM